MMKSLYHKAAAFFNGFTGVLTQSDVPKWYCVPSENCKAIFILNENEGFHRNAL